MHRYRDAIVYDMSHAGDKKDVLGPYDRTMFGAYVLFPYSDEDKYKEHDFYKSIGTVNIGGTFAHSLCCALKAGSRDREGWDGPVHADG